MATISLYVGGYRQFVENPDQILARANQALQTLERYRSRLGEATTRLSALEVEDQVTVRDVAAVAQRLEMVRRLDLELSEYTAELGTEGRLLALQMHELTTGLTELGGLLEKDYRPDSTAGTAAAPGSGAVAEPPFGFALTIASRALTARLTTTCSSCPGSARTGPSPRPCVTSSLTVSPISRFSSVDTSDTTSGSCRICGRSVCWREKASNWRVSPAARFELVRICWMSS